MVASEPRPPWPALPAASVERLAIYFGVLTTLAEAGTDTVSSNELAAAAGVNSAQLRKDLSHLGSYGTRGVGYDVHNLRYQIDQHIGGAKLWSVIIVGVGNLGRALVNHAGFSTRGFRVVGLFDADPAVIGQVAEGHRIHAMTDLHDLIGDPAATIGVIATPAQAAPLVARQLVAAGVGCLLNFAAAGLDVPPEVTVRRVDLGSELQILAYHRQRSLAEGITSPMPVLDD